MSQSLGSYPNYPPWGIGFLFPEVILSQRTPQYHYRGNFFYLNFLRNQKKKRLQDLRRFGIYNSGSLQGEKHLNGEGGRHARRGEMLGGRQGTSEKIGLPRVSTTREARTIEREGGRSPMGGKKRCNVITNLNGLQTINERQDLRQVKQYRRGKSRLNSVIDAGEREP